jgi:hypothetical protein
MRASELLAIDVDAELRTICAEQLHGSWQLPAELARYCVRRGAAAVEVTGSGQGFRMRCPGTASVVGHLGQLAVALDPEQTHAARHRALVELERDGAHALLWAAGASGVTLRIGSRSGGSATVLRRRSGSRPEIVADAPDEIPGGFEIELRAPGFELRRALDWVRSACRFAPIAVAVDGREAPQGFGDRLCSVSLGSPLAGGIALALEGDAPQLWLLRHGVVAGRAVVPGHPPFQAALELGDLTPENASPEELTLAVNPYLATLLDRAARLLVDAVDQGLDGNPVHARRAVTLILRNAISRIRSQDVTSLRALPAVDASIGSQRRLSLDEVRRAVGGGAEVWSAPAGSNLGDLPGDERLLLLLTDEQHGLMVELLGSPLPRPEPRDRRSHRRWSVPRFRDRIRRGVRNLVPGSTSRVIESGRLLDAERCLLSGIGRVAVGSDGEPMTVTVCAGAGPIRLQDGELRLPRNNPRVVQAVRLVGCGEEWLVPAALALVGRHGSVSAEARSRWRRIVYAARDSQQSQD